MSAEAVERAFRDAGARLEVRPLSYEQVIEDDAVLEGFLQRCLFDSELSLAAMREDEVLGAYLAARTRCGRPFALPAGRVDDLHPSMTKTSTGWGMCVWPRSSTEMRRR